LYVALGDYAVRLGTVALYAAYGSNMDPAQMLERCHLRRPLPRLPCPPFGLAPAFRSFASAPFGLAPALSGLAPAFLRLAPALSGLAPAFLRLAPALSGLAPTPLRLVAPQPRLVAP
jgi:hypothetical protein